MVEIKDGSDRYSGKVITDAHATEDGLRLSLSGDIKIWIHDDGQSCCESRYMRTDDNVGDLIGKRLVSIEVGECQSHPDPDGWACESQITFLHVKTDQLTVSFSFHNEHNGYYGGFWLDIKEL